MVYHPEACWYDVGEQSYYSPQFESRNIRRGNIVVGIELVSCFGDACSLDVASVDKVLLEALTRASRARSVSLAELPSPTSMSMIPLSNVLLN